MISNQKEFKELVSLKKKEIDDVLRKNKIIKLFIPQFENNNRSHFITISTKDIGVNEGDFFISNSVIDNDDSCLTLYVNSIHKVKINSFEKEKNFDYFKTTACNYVNSSCCENCNCDYKKILTNDCNLFIRFVSTFNMNTDIEYKYIKNPSAYVYELWIVDNADLLDNCEVKVINNSKTNTTNQVTLNEWISYIED